MDYIKADYMYATLCAVLFVAFLRLAWPQWKRGDRADAGMSVCLAFLLLILAVLNFKEGAR